MCFRVIDFASVTTVAQINFETVLTEGYFMFSLLFHYKKNSAEHIYIL